MANGINKIDDAWLVQQREISERMNKEHIAKFDRSFNGVMAKAGADGDEKDNKMTDITKAHQHRGPHELAASLVQHLHDRLDRHRERHGYTKSAKEKPMDSLENILKDYGPIKLCKHIVETQHAPCDEHELVTALTKAASEQFNMPGDRAFSKLYESEESVRRACSIAKAAEFSVFDISPVVVGGTQAQDVDNATAAVRAHEEIVRIAREKFPFLSADQAFARVFEDKNYAALAAQAHQRPGPTTVYAMPRAAAYTKSDPVPNTNTLAYAELMLKAEAYRNAHPDLSIAQCFTEIYTNRANVELAKRERVESAPR